MKCGHDFVRVMWETRENSILSGAGAIVSNVEEVVMMVAGGGGCNSIEKK